VAFPRFLGKKGKGVRDNSHWEYETEGGGRSWRQRGFVEYMELSLAGKA